MSFKLLKEKCLSFFLHLSVSIINQFFLEKSFFLFQVCIWEEKKIARECRCKSPSLCIWVWSGTRANPQSLSFFHFDFFYIMLECLIFRHTDIYSCKKKHRHFVIVIGQGGKIGNTGCFPPCRSEITRRAENRRNAKNKWPAYRGRGVGGAARRVACGQGQFAPLHPYISLTRPVCAPVSPYSSTPLSQARPTFPTAKTLLLIRRSCLEEKASDPPESMLDRRREREIADLLV